MARGHPVDLGHRIFPAKSSATAHFKAMLNRYSLGAAVTADDHADLLALLLRHPESERKRGSGIAGFFVGSSLEYGGRCFWLRRSDGTTTDFSYLSCISARARTLRQEFAEACRNAVFPSIASAKSRLFADGAAPDGTVDCEASGVRLTQNEATVDHKPPMTFQVLVETFLCANEITPSREMLTIPADQQVTTRFVDAQVEAAFVAYHNRAAQLRVVARRENLKLSSPNRIRAPKRPLKLR